DGNFGNSYIKIAVDPLASQSGLDLTNMPATFAPHGQNLNGYGLAIMDYFTPSDLLYRNYQDWDVGSSGITLIPNSITSTVPGHVGDPMMFAGSKEGTLYLMDRNNLGGFASTSSSKPYFKSDNAHYINNTAVYNSTTGAFINGPDAR